MPNRRHSMNISQVIVFAAYLHACLRACTHTVHKLHDTADGRNPAPVDRWFIPISIGFQPSVQDFIRPQYVLPVHLWNCFFNASLLSDVQGTYLLVYINKHGTGKQPFSTGKSSTQMCKLLWRSTHYTGRCLGPIKGFQKWVVIVNPCKTRQYHPYNPTTLLTNSYFGHCPHGDLPINCQRGPKGLPLISHFFVRLNG